MDLESIIRDALRMAQSRGAQKDKQFAEQQELKNREFDFNTGKKFNADYNFKTRELNQKDDERQRLSDIAKMNSDTNRYGYDQRLQGDKIADAGATTRQESQLRSSEWTTGVNNKNAYDIAEIQHGTGNRQNDMISRIMEANPDLVKKRLFPDSGTADASSGVARPASAALLAPSHSSTAPGATTKRKIKPDGTPEAAQDIFNSMFPNKDSFAGRMISAPNDLGKAIFSGPANAMLDAGSWAYDQLFKPRQW